MEERIRKTIKVVEEKKGLGKDRKRGWWDRECEERKREVKRSLRKWRGGIGEREKYRNGKKDYIELYERKRREENEDWERRAKEARREKEVWDIVNRERKGRKKRVNTGIEMRKWKEYFMRLLDGIERRVVNGKGNGRRKGEEGDISREDVKSSDKKAEG